MTETPIPANPDALSGSRTRRRSIYAPARSFSGLAMLLVTAIVTAALYFARDFFVPLVIAILLSFALGPLVMWLRRHHLGRVASVVVGVLLAFLIIFAIGTIIGNQLTQLAEKLPQYETNIAEKIRSIRSLATENGIGGHASMMLKDISNEIEKKPAPTDTPAKPPVNPAKAAPARLQNQTGQPPIPVEIHQPEPTPMIIIENVMGPLLRPLATAGIIVVFVIFFLLQREDLRDRFIRLAGSGDLRRTTEALDDAVGRLSRYLLMQIVINAIFGLFVGVGLWLIGIPNPILWGVLAMLLRFVPYIGPIIAAVFPLMLALAIDPDWSMLLWVAGMFLAIEMIVGQAIEPFLYGRSTGLSPVAIVVSAAFWTWLWGPVGLLLSTPLTLCLVVLGRHVARLEFLDVVLGNKPALTLEENFYQRMLAGDPDEAAHQAEAFLKDKPLAAYYDEVAIKGLALAQFDSGRGELDHERRVQIKDTVDGVIDNLSDHALPQDTAVDAAPQDELAPEWGTGAALCIAGRGLLDEAAAAMLAQLLAKEGIGARVVPSSNVSTSALHSLDASGARIVCISYLEPDDSANARYLVRRLRRKLPDVAIMIGLWTLNGDDPRYQDARRDTGADNIVVSLRQAAEHICAVASKELPGARSRR